MLNFGSLTSAAQVFQLHQSYPQTRLVVLANRPTASECNQMLSFGATACLSKETQGRDVVNAIHLASRGMHVLPRSAAAGQRRHSGRARAPTCSPRARPTCWSCCRTAPPTPRSRRALSIGLETVRTHARNIYRKLGISSRRDLARATPGAAATSS